MAEKLRVFFVSPEVVPFAKTGGLADVAGALPGALKRLGVDARLALPLYRMVRGKDLDMRLVLENLNVPIGKEDLTANILETQTEDGVPVYLIEREDMYDRPNLYGTAEGDYYDNLERFTFLAQASLKLLEHIPFRPDVIHCHDWQTGLVPALMKGPYGDIPFFRGIRCVFTIHNLGYQGLFSAEKFPLTGLPEGQFFHPEGLEYWGKISFLKAGIVYSDAITTVSPKYGQEIQTPEYGMGMDGILYHRRAYLHGILNGVDYGRWDPVKDSHLAANYSLQKMNGKSRCKKSIMDEMNLDRKLSKRPLLGMISRLDTQKGLDLLVEIIDDILALEVGLVVLGAGDEKIQNAIQEAADRHPGRVGLKIGFDEPLAHRIMAGADMFLIPSRYEPCGLTQMYALRYGTVPVVRGTGGLDDTIAPFDPKTRKGNGFKFKAYEAKAFLETVEQAIRFFNDSEAWKTVVANGMEADFSWDGSAIRYLELYRSFNDPPFIHQE